MHFNAEPTTNPPELDAIQEERSNATSRASTTRVNAEVSTNEGVGDAESGSDEVSSESENAETSDDESLRRAAVVAKSESLLDLLRTASMELLIQNSEENSRSPPRRPSFDAATQTSSVQASSVTRPQIERVASIVKPIEQLPKSKSSKNRKTNRVRILTPPKEPPPPKPKVLPNKKMEIKEEPKYLQRYLKFAKDKSKGPKPKKIKAPVDHPLFAPVKPRRHHSSRSGSSASSVISSDNEVDSRRKKKSLKKKGSRPNLNTRYPVLPKIRTNGPYGEAVRPVEDSRGDAPWSAAAPYPGATYQWNQYGSYPEYPPAQPMQQEPNVSWDQSDPYGSIVGMQQQATNWVQPQAFYAPGPSWNTYPSYQWG